MRCHNRNVSSAGIQKVAVINAVNIIGCMFHQQFGVFKYQGPPLAVQNAIGVFSTGNMNRNFFVLQIGVPLL